MQFHFDHLSGKVVRVEDNWMTIRDHAGKNWSFYLTDFEPDALIDEMVHVLFGARNTTSQKTFAALQNVSRGSLSVRGSHFKEMTRPDKYYTLAAISASLCCLTLLYFRNHTDDLFSLQVGFAMLVLCAGWVFPLSILERKRFAYSRGLTTYLKGLIPAPVSTAALAQLPSPADDDVEII